MAQYLRERLGFEIIDNEGNILDLRDKNKFFIKSVDGLDHVEIRMNSSNLAGKDGMFLGRQNYNGRTISISGIFRGYNENQTNSLDDIYAARQEFLCRIARFKNPVRLIIYEQKDDLTFNEYECECKVSDYNAQWENENTMHEWALTLKTEKPFIYSRTTNALILSQTVVDPGDWIAPDNTGTDQGDTLPDIIGILVSGLNVINNNSCIPVYPIITITGKFTGPVKIQNQSNGDTLIISGNQTLAQYIEIDCFKQTVIRNGSMNVISLMTGDWLTIQPGSNIYNWTGVDIVDATCTVRWKECILGL